MAIVAAYPYAYIANNVPYGQDLVIQFGSLSFMLTGTVYTVSYGTIYTVIRLRQCNQSINHVGLHELALLQLPLILSDCFLFISDMHLTMKAYW